MKVIVLYDGSLHAKTALDYSFEKAREKQGELVVLLVFQSSLYLDYDGGIMAQNAARAEMNRYTRDIEHFKRERQDEVNIRIITEEGNPGQELLNIAKTEQADLMVAPARYKSIARKAPCPASFIPGTVLVPVDGSEMPVSTVEEIVLEARITASRVLILGVVPVHLYGSKEIQELEQVRKKTESSVSSLKRALHERNIETEELVRAGYPYEEILRTAEEFTTALIMLPSGGTAPSELTKATAILLDEPSLQKLPIHLFEVSRAY